MKRNPADFFAIIVGIFLIIEGIWGFFSPVVFTVFTTNTAHAGIHLLLGLAGVYFGYRYKARGYCWFLGGLLLLVGILRFIPGPDDLLISILNINMPVTYLNLAVGVAALAVAAISKGHQPETYVPKQA